MPMNYADLLGPTGDENNMGGTEQFFYLARHSDVLTWSAPAVAPASPYKLTTPIVMKTGKKFVTVYCTLDTSELDMAINGSMDGYSFKPSFKFKYPGLDDATIDFINTVLTDKLVVLVPLWNGKIIQLGSAKICAYMKPDIKTNKVSGDGIGTDFEVMTFSPRIYTYAGAIPLTPAV